MPRGNSTQMNREHKIEIITRQLDVVREILPFPLNFIVFPYYYIVSLLLLVSGAFKFHDIGILWATAPIWVSWFVWAYIPYILIIGLEDNNHRTKRKKRNDRRIF